MDEFEEEEALNKQKFWARMDAVGVSRAEFAADMKMNVSSVYNWNEVPQYAEYILNYLERFAGKDCIAIPRSDWEGLIATQERWFGAKEMAGEMLERLNGRN